MTTILVFSLLISALLLLCSAHIYAASIVLLFSIILYWLIGSGLCAAPLLSSLQIHPPLHPIWQKNNAILLLGSGTVRTVEQNEIQPAILSYGRILETYKLYYACKKAQQHCTIIISGADVLHTGETEAEAYQKFLLSLGVAPTDFLLDTKSQNTFENAKFIQSLLATQPIDQTILVTSGFHVKRAALYFRHFGPPVILAPADTLQPRLSWLPMAYNFMLTQIAVHEYVDIWQYYFYHALHVKQK